MLLSEKELTLPEYPHFDELDGKEDLEIAAFQRVESYIDKRYCERQVEWIVDDVREFEIPLTPYEIISVEHWSNMKWNAQPIFLSPLGLEFSGCGQYRVTAKLGVGENLDVPEFVKQALIRYVNYQEQAQDNAGLSQYAVNMDGAIQESWTRSGSAAARALDLSGAADLLRYIRRAK